MDSTKPWCACIDKDRSDGWSHIGDQVWVHPQCGKQSRMSFERWLGMEQPERYFSLPPRGITVSTASFGPDDKRHTYTYFCDANPECYAVAYGSTEESVRRQLKGHVCPAPARRDAHPSGRPVIQKAWDELDDVIERIKSENISEDESIELQSYARGVAEVLAYLAIPHFRFRDDILREANKRWKIRHGLIPWAATPGYNFFPAEPLKYAHVTAPDTKATARRTAAKSTPMKPATPAAAPVRTFTPDEVQLIRDSLHDAGIPAEDLAKMYGVTADRIRTVAGRKEQADLPPPPMFGLF